MDEPVVANGLLHCPGCGRDVPFNLRWKGKSLMMMGCVFPTTEAFLVEFFRRRVPALCRNCYEGTPAPKVRPSIILGPQGEEIA